jgi:hypothetical protein
MPPRPRLAGFSPAYMGSRAGSSRQASANASVPPCCHSIRVSALGDILLALRRQVITVTGISVIHPLSINTLSAAAAEAGATASLRDQQKQNASVRIEPNGYAFVPFSVESFRRSGKPAMKLLHDLGDAAAWPGGVTRLTCFAGALRELSIGLIRRNYFMFGAGVGGLARVTG